MFFDAGETLVHPVPSFPELFARIVREAGHVRDPADVVEASRAVMARFSEAARDGDLWTTSPERSREFWLGVYERMLRRLDLPSTDGLRDALYEGFTDLDNYAAFVRDSNFRTALMVDNLHPNDAGYARLGQTFYDAIAPLLPAGP